MKIKTKYTLVLELMREMVDEYMGDQKMSTDYQTERRIEVLEQELEEQQEKQGGIEKQIAKLEILVGVLYRLNNIDQELKDNQ